MKIVTVEQMQRIEAESDQSGQTYRAMMEQAGRSVALAIGRRQAISGKHVLVLVGPGNNGGDGLVAARYLSEAGARVTCYLHRDRNPTEDENFRLVLEGKVRTVLAEEDDEWSALRELAGETDVLVDALLGTGTRLPLRGRLAEMLSSLRPVVAQRRAGDPDALATLVPRRAASSVPRPLLVAVDGPTGLKYDTGDLDDRTIAADLTVTFAFPKPGHFRFPGAGAVGELVVADIGVDPALAGDVSLEVVTAAQVRAWLPERPPDAHKGTFGKAMIAAGSVNYTGAAFLAGASATRAGAGLVTLAVPSAIHGSVAARLAEATYVLLPHAMGVVNPAAAEVLHQALAGYDALLIGPGLGRARETKDFLERLLGGEDGQHTLGFLRSEDRHLSRPTLPPLVIDADGLNILADWAGWSERLPPGTVLTPHPGEMARLMDASVEEVQEDRIAVARDKASEWGQVILLKGAHTVVAAPDGRVMVEPFANPGLATAGTGDVLAGVIVALRAQGMGAIEAAAAGAYLHGLAGEVARDRQGLTGLVAGDVLASLPEAWRRLNSG